MPLFLGAGPVTWIPPLLSALHTTAAGGTMTPLQAECAWFTVHLWSVWVGAAAFAETPSGQLLDHLPGWVQPSWPLMPALMSSLFHQGVPQDAHEDLQTQAGVVVKEVGMRQLGTRGALVSSHICIHTRQQLCCCCYLRQLYWSKQGVLARF
jgi:hypothetical protein